MVCLLQLETISSIDLNDVDCLFVSCTALKIVDLIAELEKDLKTTISQLSNSKDEELQLGEDVNYCINKYNLWSESSTSNPEELAKLYDENLELAKCLREKGIEVEDPSQQQPKLDLSGLKKSEEDITPLLQECGYGDLFFEK